MPAGIIVLFVLLVVAGWLVSRWWKEERRKKFRVLAQRLGLQYSPDDPFGLDGLPFTLFSRGDGRGWENVLWGTWHNLEVQAFDYWYYEERRDAEGRTSRDYDRFSCAVADLPLTCPHTTIGPENLLT